ncbi:hypothetical protein D3C81_1705710 [compost metagenome]
MVGFLHSTVLHPRRAYRHAGYSNPEKVGALSQLDYLLGRHVAFNKFPIDHRSVAGREARSDAQLLLDRAHVCVCFYMINDGEAVRFKVLNPLLAASAVKLSIDINRQRFSSVGS